MFAEGCQKAQKAINADHLYMFYNIVGLVQSPDRHTDEQINRQTDTNIHTINTVAHAQYYNYTSAGPLFILTFNTHTEKQF